MSKKIAVSAHLWLNEAEIDYCFIASPGPGGQNVNKVATAVQLRFNVLLSPSLPEALRLRLLSLLGSKVNNQGEVVIKASRYRTQERNREDALQRLIAWIQKAAYVPRKRRKTKPTRGSVEKRLQKKKLHSTKKTLRRAL